jgi:hypothetical protein
MRLDFVAFLARLEELYRLRRHYSRDRMLIHELRMGVPTKQDAEIVEPGNDPLKFHAIHKKNRDGRFVLPDVIKKYVLNIL